MQHAIGVRSPHWGIGRHRPPLQALSLRAALLADRVGIQMAKYKIAWMPGDGVGHDVMEAARLVLDRLGLDAEYVPCEIGWEFWCKEGNALPDRTVKVLKETTCGLFGAITSKPQSEAKEELAPKLKGKGLVYFSPIVGLRQLFNLHTNMRPCKSYPGNPLNFRGNKIPTRAARMCRSIRLCSAKIPKGCTAASNFSRCQ